jgi:glutamate-5-semialdehyde dehydrogenase
MNAITPQAATFVATLTERARACVKPMAVSHHDSRNTALTAISGLIRTSGDAIMAANAKDITAAKDRNLGCAMIGRLTLNPDRIEAMAKGLEDISALEDPIGRELERWQQPNGLDITRISTPLGVLGVIYESRPNVTVDAAGLAIKSSNPVILRGGSDSIHTATVLAELIRKGLDKAGLPRDSVQLVENTDRALVGAMLAAIGGIDVIIPRGGRSLVERVQQEARVPVFAHLEGICHIYIDASADPDKAEAVTVNAKMRRVEICGAAETLLVDKAIAKNLLPRLGDALRDAGCVLVADDEAMAILSEASPATDDDYRTEYLDTMISVAIVDGVEGAISHIDRYGSNHTDSIITEDEATAERFLAEIDSAIVMVNASTQFADGNEFGMGAEIGISTGRMHARGPVGAMQLTSFKYMVRGTGQIRP